MEQKFYTAGIFILLPANSADHDFRALRGFKGTNLTGVTVTAFQFYRFVSFSKQPHFF